MPALARLWMGSHRGLLRFYRLLHAVLGGLGLGILTTEDLHAISEQAYTGIETYQDDEYNRRGLSPWERDAIESHFQACRRILVAAAGGGREVLALRRLGLEADGFEANPRLVAYANDLLEREGYGDPIRLAPWDGCPEYERKYDGVVIGWGAYMHIRGRDRRIALLAQLRPMVETGSPLLLSFVGVKSFSRWMRAAYWIGKTVGTLSRRDRVELGDWLEPNYKHYFTEDALTRELRQGGFETVEYHAGEIGSAVGIAIEEVA